MEAALSPREKKALLWGGVAFVLIGVVLAVFALVPNSRGATRTVGSSPSRRCCPRSCSSSSRSSP
ncbi:hypothetical protein QJS66_16320 [Kocuria rhizophila]|nr:hypothetical protein QJS66_16320 [Kocuria rhizophila]